MSLDDQPDTSWVDGAVSPAVHEHHADLWSGLAHWEADLVRAVAADEGLLTGKTEIIGAQEGS